MVNVRGSGYHKSIGPRGEIPKRIKPIRENDEPELYGQKFSGVRRDCGCQWGSPRKECCDDKSRKG